MNIKLEEFRAPPGKRVRLDRWPTAIDPLYKSKKQYRKRLAADTEELSALQRLLYASHRYSVLLIFQAMDTAGKDGAISHVLTGVNPQGCDVTSFKRPSANELDQDFLWRTTCRLPARGRIGVFNRSYYEEVLIVRVHEEDLKAEGLGVPDGGDKGVWKGRYRSIIDQEEHLHRNGTRIIKFFLHLSKEEQRKRLLERIDDPDRNWKFSKADISERRFWNRYATAYEECLGATTTASAPWHIVPADDKYNARLIISRTVIEALQGLAMSYPTLTRERRKELAVIRKDLDCP